MITGAILEDLDSHWAITAVPSSVRERADYVAKARLVRVAVSNQMDLDFVDEPTDDEFLERVATAYEIAVAEVLGELLSPSFGDMGKQLQLRAQAAAYRIYEYRRALAVPAGTERRIFHVLHLSAVAYCGDRWAEQRRWLKENPEQAEIPIAGKAPWDLRLLYRLFECWVRLVRKDGWADLNAVSEVIAQLRNDQSHYESLLLGNSENGALVQGLAYRLVALYHWARATDLLALYMLQGEPVGVAEELDRHFEAAREAALASGDMSFDILLRWLHVAARRMVLGSVWWVTRVVNSRVTKFVQHLTHQRRGMFELLPPQRIAIQREGLLDPAKRAIVVDMPTSGGKTALAQFRMLQALNQFDADDGWVAYVAPTRALVAQVTRRLRRDFSSLGVIVEQLSGAVETDSYEEAILDADSPSTTFDILVSTPEKLQFVIRNKKVNRPLALVVVDEAHNIQDEERGLRIELLLATIRRDCPTASFLLLMPFVPNAQDLASWLAPEAGAAISLSTTAWQPNDRVVGMYSIEKGAKSGDWSLKYETLVTVPRTIHLKGRHDVGGNRPLAVSYSKARSLTLQTSAMASAFCHRGTSLAVARTIPDTWSMARSVANAFEPLNQVHDEIQLVQRFLATEVSSNFELIGMLERGIGVHHAGLSDEARSLIEWLAENDKLKVLCATSTVSQGINFPVASVFLSTRSLASREGKKMSARDFWNLAGRAGRIDQGSVGVVGIAAGDKPENVQRFVSEATGELVSRLKEMVDEVFAQGQISNLQAVLHRDQWRDFRSYVAHLWHEKQDLDAVLAETEQLLRNTFGYSTLQRKQDADSQMKARSLLEATKAYASQLSLHPENAILSDATGFAPEGVRSAILGMGALNRSLTNKDWAPESLFGSHGLLRDLVGVMLSIPELRGQLEDIGGTGISQTKITAITQLWVQGAGIEEIAMKYFSGTANKPVDLTGALSAACRAVYRTLSNIGTWGIASLTKVPTSGLDFDTMTPEEKRRINNLPAMVYYGVQTEAAILMRMQSVPRSVAESLGHAFLKSNGSVDQPDSSLKARRFVKSLSDGEWQKVVPSGATMTGADYRTVWSWLSGEDH